METGGGDFPIDNLSGRICSRVLLVEEKLLIPEISHTAANIQQKQGGRLSEILLSQGLVKAQI